MHACFALLAIAHANSATTAPNDAVKPAPVQQPAKEESYHPIGVYFGGFGGWGYRSSSNHASQTGTAFFPASAGGPLAVNATGRLHNNSFGFGGVHAGWEWLRHRHDAFRFTPGGELEALYFAYTRKGDLINPTTRLPEHDFKDKFPLRTYTVLANATLAFDNDYVAPYIEAGIGANMAWIHHANSAQVAPPEPGINHFNSDPNAFDWVFAAQAKGGLRYSFFDHYRLFGEYRFLYTGSTTYHFGATVYPTHVPTTRWKVKFRHAFYNLFSAGIDFTF